MVDLHHIGCYIICIRNGYSDKKYCPKSWSAQIEANTKAAFGQIVEQSDMCDQKAIVFRYTKVFYVQQFNG